MRSRPVKPRASRIALIVASVPELTMRSSSIDGMSADDPAGELGLDHGRRAEREAVGARLRDGRDHVRMRVAEDHRPPGADVVD